ncbi:DUF484 family protein [Rudaea cellulosilytica]|uniref:DUF484 family protein n=1 Tax=Rudaea cellulosilytica TaxID=540746 RepID=UPI0003618620|nr:DUF484 family protein [Rudaea cellulosilytica]
MNDTAIKDGVTPAEVASYLRRHPAFLHDYPDLALTLLPPREEGKTTSLASYQLDVLRDKNRELGRRLTELVNIANENEQLVQRVHALNLSLMREATLAGSVRRVVAGLREDFSTDFVRLVLLRADPELPAADWLIVQPQGVQALPEFAEFFRNGEALCGRLQPEKLDFLFGKHAGDVHSSALHALGERDAPLGLLAIGSADANRFHPGMGTMFLKLIAETVAAAIARFPAHG